MLFFVTILKGYNVCGIILLQAEPDLLVVI